MIGFEPALKKDGSPDPRKGSFFPYRLTKRKGLDEAHTVNLLLLENDDSEPVAKQHFVLIKNLGRLLYDTSGAHCKKHICMSCLRG